MAKRKNLNPKAFFAKDGYECGFLDKGVDINRNYPVSWGEGFLAQVPKHPTELFTENDIKNFA